MATRWINITGKIFWAQLVNPDSAFGSSNWKLDLYPETEEAWNLIKESGIQKTVKESEHGKYISLTRPTYKMMKGSLVFFTPPAVEDKDGTVIVDYVDKELNKRVLSYEKSAEKTITKRGTDVLLGNGTVATVNVAVYDTMKGKGSRLESVKVLDLVEFHKEPQGLRPVRDGSESPLVVNIETPKAPTKGVSW